MTTERAKVNVLFLHAQADFAADSTIHAHLIRHLDRSRFVAHVACTRGEGNGIPDSLAKFSAIPDTRMHPTSFAPGFRERSARTILRGLPTAARFPLDYVGLAAYIARERIRIIHSTDRPRDSVYAVTLGRLTGAKSIVHVHVKWSEGYSAPAKWAVRNADAAFSISKFVTQSIVDFGKPAERVHTVLNAVETSRWDPTISGRGVREEFGVPADAPLVISVSRLFAEKGQPELLRALARVKKAIPAVRLLVVGAETPFSRGFIGEMKALSVELGIQDAVTFTGPRSDIPEIMAACDVFALPSYEEPFGLVYLEAMAMQRPVAALTNGGTPEVVEHGLSGLLSPHRDVDALAKNLIELLNNPDKRRMMGAHGRARVLDYFNTRRMARDAEAAYDAILRS